jgi:hypothetical protein
MRRVILFVFILAAICLALASVKLDFINAVAGGHLYWNDHEAFIFVNVVHRGHRSSYLKLPVELAKEAIGGVLPTDDQRSSVLVFRITPETVQRYVKENSNLGSYRPVSDRIYARGNDGLLWKWSGTQFDQADSQELHNFEAGPYPPSPEYDQFDGWSCRYEILGRTSLVNVPLKINNETLAITVKKDAREVSVALTRPGGVTETIWSLETAPRKVTQSEYERLFAKP